MHSRGGIVDDLTLAWREHRRYVGVAAGVFILGTLAGIGLVVAGVGVFARLGVNNLEEMLPERFTVWTILVNNTRAFVTLILGALTLGLVTLLGAFVNGLLVGVVATPAVAQEGVGPILTLLAPHGIVELPALFIAAGVGLRLVHLGGTRVFGSRQQFVTRGELGRIGLIVGVGWLMLALAAVLEVHLTPALYEALYGSSPLS